MPDDATITARSLRPPQDNIPQTRQQRDGLLQIVGEYVEQERPVGPLSIEELRTCAEAVLKKANLNRKYLNYTGVLINNEVWRRTVAGIPFEKRLLLLPKCLRSAEECPAEFDEVGLVCEHCGRCIINEFKSQAERLGYAVLIAEGSPVVMSLIETGKIEAVVDVSCLSVLERVFPYMEAGAVPGIAIPLLQDGCANTSVDVDWVWDAIYQSNDDRTHRLNLDDLQTQVNSWFTEESLSGLLAAVDSRTEHLALEWMAKVGKRWRPFLAACTYQALARRGGPAGNKEGALPEALRKAAVAVECFHKASLIHDDIEDGDDLRYGEKTLHAEHGVPIALNVGDLLLGEGYRLLVEADASDSCRTRMLAAAVQGHRNLCIGQGDELSWIRRPRCLSVAEVVDIFQKKTSPAFEVALKLGAILAGCSDELNGVLEEYSRSLGIAYQIRDDIEDFRLMDESHALNAMRPSLMLALACERAGQAERELLERVWNRSAEPRPGAKAVEVVLAELKVERLASDLMESYKARAIGSLYHLRNSDLKGLLRRVIGKIFNDFEVMGCCNDRKAGHAQGGESSQARPG
jgi:geranylgeranyl pyrophosphate synthase